MTYLYIFLQVLQALEANQLLVTVVPSFTVSFFFLTDWLSVLLVDPVLLAFSQTCYCYVGSGRSFYVSV